MRSHINTALISTLFLSLANLQAEPHLVTAQQAKVYDGSKPAGALYSGEIVDATPASKDWLEFTRAGKAYRVRAVSLISQGKLQANAAAQKIELQGVITQTQQDLDALYAERNELDALRISTRRDLGVTIVFPGVHVQHVPTTAVTQSRGGTIISTVPKLTIHPEKIATLKESDARKVLKRIDDFEEANTAKIAALETRLQKAQLTQAHNKLKHIELTEQFDRFQVFPDDYRRTNYAVTANRTSVYRNRQRVGELKQAQIISGKQSLKSPDWIELNEFPGGPALVRAKDLQTKHQLLASLTKSQELARQSVAAMQREVDRLLAVRGSLTAAHRNLEILIERDQRYVNLHPDKLARRRNQPILGIPIGAIESANTHQAKKQVRAFEKDLESINARLQQARKELLLQQRRQATLKTREAAIKAQFPK